MLLLWSVDARAQPTSYHAIGGNAPYLLRGNAGVLSGSYRSESHKYFI